MSLIKQVEIRTLTSAKSGMVEFYTPQSSHETMLVQVAAGVVDDIFVHHFQTDQLLVVRGSFVLVILQNRQYRYIPLSEHLPAVATIPAGVPHGAINFSDEPCVMVNAVLRHGIANERDYRPMKPRIPYNLAAAKAALEQLLHPATA
ncbi:MAG: cupin domain-containing protein [Microcoleus vaginatus WJT46-NPBG5]|jgi:dTDP-4-dehydrorhamnose 3,5-epimerase-like enzyme|nr:cupin domain-containing protein [Microcoleus vaginatus WJT46-NPBG5]